MSVIIQLQWKDNATNETDFFVYRSASPEMTTGDTRIAHVQWNGTSWDASDVNSEVSSVTAIDTLADPSATGLFKIQFTDAVAGDFYYGVSAGNATGESDVVPTTTSVTIS